MLVSTALIRPLAWEPPNAVGVAPEKTKRQKKKKELIQLNSKNSVRLQMRRVSV